MYKTADIYIIDAKRTPVGKLYGSLASVRPDDLISGLISGFFQSNKQLVSTELDALILGCGNQAGEDNRNIARMAVLLCGLPHNVYAATVNSLCSSGLDSVLQAARMIACGEADFCLAGGVETMSRSPYIESRIDGTREDSTLGWRFTNDRITDFIPTHSMPETAELLSKKYSISRAEQDNYAFLSRNRYEFALKTGFYNNEILPVFEKDKNLLLDRDEQHRILSISLLEQLPTLVKSGTHITLGNSARIGDGAAIVALASENYIKRHNILPLARIAAMANAAEHPDLMGMSGISALKKASKQSGINLSDIDIFELSEAFAVQILAAQKEGLADLSKINTKGGSISIGNPLGMGAARLLTTLLNQLKSNKNLNYGAAASGAGLGTGAAIILENLD
jgi:acetyl-CoA acetyltransferase family protein